MLSRDARFALSIAAVATCVYRVVLEVARAADCPLTVMWVPLPCSFEDFWLVAPGAGVLGLALYAALRSLRKRHRIPVGAALGAVLGPVNACLAVLASLVLWEVEGRLGLCEPWRYGFGCLVHEWWRTLGLQLEMSMPVAIPCGLIMGGLLGWASGRDRPDAPAPAVRDALRAGGG